jgi:hypothetical protein
VNFAWPIEASVEKIPILPKNIAKNFMQKFFKKFGYGFSVDEGRRVLRKVRDASYHLCLFLVCGFLSPCV